MADYRVNLSLTIFLKISLKILIFLPFKHSCQTSKRGNESISSDLSIIFTIRFVSKGHANSRNRIRRISSSIRTNYDNTVSRITRKLITTHPSSFTFKMIRTILLSMSTSVAKFHAIPYILYESAFSKTSLRRRDHLIFRTIFLRIVCRANHRDHHIFFRSILLSRFQLERIDAKLKLNCIELYLESI